MSPPPRAAPAPRAAPPPPPRAAAPPPAQVPAAAPPAAPMMAQPQQPSLMKQVNLSSKKSEYFIKYTVGQKILKSPGQKRRINSRIFF